MYINDQMGMIAQWSSQQSDHQLFW